jgi:hypothetical protein
MFLERKLGNENSRSSRSHLRSLLNARLFRDRVLVVGHADMCGGSNIFWESKFVS